MSESKTRGEATVKIACVQLEPVVGDKARNVRRTLECIEPAAAGVPHAARPARHVHLLRRMVPRELSALRAPGSRHRLHSHQLGADPGQDKERGQPFVGQSLIVSYTGWPIAGPASPDQEEIIYAEAHLADARRKRNWNEYNQVLGDRRTDVYDEMLGAKLSRGWY